MRRFLRNIVLFFLIQAGVWACVLWLHVRLKNHEKDYVAATIDKHDLLDQQPSPRIIFVGGSSAAFGLDSQKIGQSLGYHPVNMGIKVTLGLNFMLEEVETSLRSGRSCLSMVAAT